MYVCFCVLTPRQSHSFATRLALFWFAKCPLTSGIAGQSRAEHADPRATDRASRTQKVLTNVAERRSSVHMTRGLAPP